MSIGRGGARVVAVDRRCGVVVGFWGKPAHQLNFVFRANDSPWMPASF